MKISYWEVNTSTESFIEEERNGHKSRTEDVLTENFLLGREVFLYILSLFLESVRNLFSFLQ